MSFLEGIASPGSLTRSDLASLVNEGIGNGMSGNAMLREAQAAGIGIRRADFLQLVGEVRSSLAGQSAIQALAMDQLADESMITQWTGGAVNTYLHRVTLYVREGPPGGKEIVTHKWDILSDHVLSGRQATEAASERFINGQSDDNYSDQELLGSELRNIYHQEGSQ